MKAWSALSALLSVGNNFEQVYIFLNAVCFGYIMDDYYIELKSSLERFEGEELGSVVQAIIDHLLGLQIEKEGFQEDQSTFETLSE